MDNLIQADIFFFITTAAVVIVSIALLAILIYVLLILKDAKKVSNKVKEETELVAADLDEMRREMKKEGRRLKPMVAFVAKVFKKFGGKKKS